MSVILQNSPQRADGVSWRFSKIDGYVLVIGKAIHVAACDHEVSPLATIICSTITISLQDVCFSKREVSNVWQVDGSEQYHFALQ